jgi:(1->4)-alpha-D-glucan 1-alpha-D-glucosylmutase
VVGGFLNRAHRPGWSGRVVTEHHPSAVPTDAAATYDADLDRLARCYGIQPDYQDVWGRRHVVGDHTRRALLGAMGVDAADAAAVRRSLEEHGEARRRRMLEPVLVLVESARIAVPIRLPETAAGSGTAELRWRLREERGEVHSGSLRLAELTAAEPETAAEPSEPSGSHDGSALLPLDLRLPTGYHRLHVEVGARRASLSLIIVPERCYLPQALLGETRWWGLAAQLYSVRRAHDWGIGDFSALPGLIRTSARHGAALVGLSPLHAMFAARPQHASPYSPSSRLFLNVLFIDVERVAEVRDSAAARELLESPAMTERLNELRAASLIDYPAVAQAKLGVLEKAFADFHGNPHGARHGAFRRFCDAEGDELVRHAIFEALHEHFHAHDPQIYGWRQWPRAYQDPASAAVAQFAREHAERVDFYCWLQWLAAEQLAAAARLAESQDLAGGLYVDVAVSVDQAGAEAWANQHLYALDAAIGAPPDVYSPKGQNWGLPPLNPLALTESAYALFVDTLRKNMRHAGAVRIDHVMALMRLFWIPRGAEPADGAYVGYPLADLLGILALESQRNRCLVVGEDLGTVPPELAEPLARLRILSYRLLYFEQHEDGRFRPPDAYPAQALVAVSTHDLPTLAGWWEGRDLAWRSRLALFPDEASERDAVTAREADRQALLQALEDAALQPLPEGAPHTLLTPAHRFLARTPAMLQLVQIEDALGLPEQANLPGTVDEHPNWRRRIPVTLEDVEVNAQFRDIVGAVAEERSSKAKYAAASLGWPRATYRLQLNKDFTFDAARALIPYLDALGISHAYVSPYLQSRAGSVHGYDVIDPESIDSDIGSRRAHADWVAALAERGMSHVLDIVPNHMGVMGDDNAWWLDVLEHGEAARHSGFFDIDWQPPERALAGKVLIPVLGDSYGETLDQGQLQLGFDDSDGRFGVRYHEHLFPIDPREYPLVLNLPPLRTEGEAGEADAAGARLDDVDDSLPDAARQELASIGAAFGKLPRRSNVARGAVAERYRDSELLRQRLVDLCRLEPAVVRRIRAQLALLNAGGSYAKRALHELLERQAWRLAHWRTASDEINYRRFFDINDLAGLRVEDPVVFEASHRRILSLVARGTVTGLRLDHPDGLYDPTRYFRQLADRCAEVRPAHAPATYLVAEKILGADESLPADWSLSGTTGYEFAALVNGVFVDPAGERPLDRCYERFVGQAPDFHELAYQCKHLVMQQLLAGELRVLGNRLHRLAQADLRTRDFTRNGLTSALREIVACFPVYRTYIRSSDVSDSDRAHVEQALAGAKRRCHASQTTVLDFIGELLLQRRSGGPGYQRGMLDFAMKVQQFTAPVTAKGVEDTALYRYARLLSLNDVGDEPSRFGVSVATFHHSNLERQARWPNSMLSTSSHDSKRGEDARARLNVLAEVPTEWQARVRAWRRWNQPLLARVHDAPAPSANDEYFLYQTLLGSWPLEELDEPALAEFRGRIRAYMSKAVREAKHHTSWIAPDDAYERSLGEFIDALLDSERSERFLTDFLEFKRRLAPAGMLNGLAQTLLKLTAPGVPDIFQGSDLWNFSLVDPDNRRPVDYALRARILERLGPPGHIVSARELLADLPSGLPKLYVIRQALHLRRHRPALFERGAYLPLELRGTLAAHLCAFARLDDPAVMVVVVPRLIFGLCSDGGAPPLGERWGDTELVLPEHLLENARVSDPAARLRNALTGATMRGGDALRVAEVLASFPVALLVNEQAELGAETTAEFRQGKGSLS